MNGLALYAPSSRLGRTALFTAGILARLGIGSFLYRLLSRETTTTGKMPFAVSEAQTKGIVSDCSSALGASYRVGAVGLGSTDEFQKATLLIEQEGGPGTAVVKVGVSPVARRLIKHEIQALGELTHLHLRRLIVPRVLARGSAANLEWFAQERLHAAFGRPRLREAHFGALAELHRLTSDVLPLESCPAFEGAIEGGEFSSMISASDVRFLQHLRQEVVRRVKRGPCLSWPVGLGHGDFSPANTSAGSGQVHAYDWEGALVSAPFGWDLMHFICAVRSLVYRQPPEQVHRFMLSGRARSLLGRLEKMTGPVVPNTWVLTSLVLLNFWSSGTRRMLTRESSPRAIKKY